MSTATRENARVGATLFDLIDGAIEIFMWPALVRETARAPVSGTSSGTRRP